VTGDSKKSNNFNYLAGYHRIQFEHFADAAFGIAHFFAPVSRVQHERIFCRRGGLEMKKCAALAHF
jgi:hypothetical protein